MEKKVLIILFFSLIVNASTSASNDIYFHKISIEDDLSQLSVRTIYQDEFGTLWFGTREGINKFNGNSINIIYPTFDDKNALPESLIYNICGDKNGHIYIHSQNGVIKYNLKSATFSTVTQNSVNHISYGLHCLWIAEQKSIYSYKKGKKTKYVELENVESPISCVFQASDMRIYAGTISSGVFVIDQNKNVKTIINKSSEITCFFEDNKKNIWIATLNNGVYKIERNGEIKNYTTTTNPQKTNICSNYARTICQDDNGLIWIGTYKGLNKLNPETEQFTHYGSEKNSELFLTNESVWSLHKDNQGTIWAGTYFGGVNYFNPDVNFYNYHDLQKGVFQNKPFPVISNIIEYDNQSIFLCSEGSGLIYYNLKDKSYKVFLANDKNPNSITANNIKAVHFDKAKNELWLGTHLGGVCVLNTQKWEFTKYPPIKPAWPNANNVHAILPYKENLLVATQNGLFILNKEKKTFTLFCDKLHNITHVIHDIKIDKMQNLWIASINGLYKYDLENKNIYSYFYNVDNPESLSHNNTVKILIDSKDRVWIATSGGGLNLYNKETDGFIHYNKTQYGLINDYVSNMRESFLGNIIISTTEGLALLDVEKNKLHNFSKNNGFPLNSLFSGGINISNNGEIFIAGMSGLVSFFEEDLTSPHKNFNLHFVNLWINNNIVTINDKTKILNKSMLYTNKIHLNAKQKTVSIEFASDNYIQADHILYRYRLEGFSDTWIELKQSDNKLNFMNLNSGKYNLIIEGLLREDASVIDSINLLMIISPPIYETWYAYLFYVLLISVIAWRFIVFNRSKLLLKTSLDYEKKEKEHLESVNQSKLRFFTNISHEFRTPLTLIRGQVDMLLQTHNISPVIYNRILNIKRNTINMQNLINELLEFRKSELGHLKIKVSQHDIISFINEIFLSFSEYANYTQINFDYEHIDNRIDIWFDAVQIQKVIYNLISNAFKYTPKGGKIKILVEQTNENVLIKIFDSGIGISPEEIEKIFDRFYQAENGLQINNSKLGTGIGLALAKSILKEHSAYIKVESELNSGSCFSINLKKGLSHFTKEQIADAIHYDADASCVLQINELDTNFIQELVQIRMESKDNLKYSILIVEDNKELCSMLKNIFEPIYKVYKAYDGEEGLALTIKHMPDIVLTDLMMPKMSGSEMCAKIKSNFSVCHIPVVLLTAQTALEANIEGLMLGADDYITKPFDVKILITRCNNLINNRKMLQEKFSKNTSLSIKQLATNEIDRLFLEKAHEVINKFIQDTDFDINKFSSEMALSRTNLFRKIKGVSGQTPNEFINTIRLQKSVEFFRTHPEYSISEISYKVGFTSPKYFGKCFKNHYGVSPGEYRIKKE